VILEDYSTTVYVKSFMTFEEAKGYPQDKNFESLQHCLANVVLGSFWEGSAFDAWTNTRSEVFQKVEGAKDRIQMVADANEDEQKEDVGTD